MEGLNGRIPGIWKGGDIFKNKEEYQSTAMLHCVTNNALVTV
jgi:hypothetical protein